ncbi:MAG: hypothetical protein LUC97_11355 [Clostridiales bacterium]|nr:hypothetical protein [Clostridiales bacterium]
MNYGNIFVVETNIINLKGREVRGFSAAKAAFLEECEKHFLNKPPSDVMVLLWQRYDICEEGIVDYMDCEKWARLKAG